MSASVAIAAPVSRPKIHRLPGRRAVLPSPKNTPALALGIILMSFVGTVGFLNLLSDMLGPKSDDRNLTEVPEMVSSAQAAVTKIEDSLGADTDVTHPQGGKTIVIAGQSGAIVGQMAKIPVPEGPMAEITTSSEVDNNTGRELLSIVNKY